MRRWIQWLKCRLMPLGGGHVPVPTGRGGWLLAEYRCDECGKLLIGHVEHPGIYLTEDPTNDDLRKFFTEIGPK